MSLVEQFASPNILRPVFKASAMSYVVGTCATLFIMNCGIHQGIRCFLLKYIHPCYQARRLFKLKQVDVVLLLKTRRHAAS